MWGPAVRWLHRESVPQLAGGGMALLCLAGGAELWAGQVVRTVGGDDSTLGPGDHGTGLHGVAVTEWMSWRPCRVWGGAQCPCVLVVLRRRGLACRRGVAAAPEDARQGYNAPSSNRIAFPGSLVVFWAGAGHFTSRAAEQAVMARSLRPGNGHGSAS